VIDIVESIARDAGECALRSFRPDGGVGFESKAHLDLVTEADRAVEALIVARLRAAFPDDGIVGEEGTATPSRSGRIWVIDPIDGTFNYVRGIDQWSVSIGLFDGKKPLLGVLNLPAQRKLVIGGQGVAPRLNGIALRPLPPFDPRRAVVAIGLGPASATSQAHELVREISQAGLVFRYCGCGSVSLLSVALGEVDGYVSLAETSWDVMAGLAILQAIGIRDTVDWTRVSLREKFSMRCGGPEILDLMAPFSLRLRM
jgi:myo-inositol-1(or 4)-monophosphatase